GDGANGPAGGVRAEGPAVMLDVRQLRHRMRSRGHHTTPTGGGALSSTRQEGEQHPGEIAARGLVNPGLLIGVRNRYHSRPSDREGTASGRMKTTCLSLGFRRLGTIAALLGMVTILGPPRAIGYGRVIPIEGASQQAELTVPGSALDNFGYS